MTADYEPSIRGSEIEEHVKIDVIPEGDLVISIKEKMEQVSVFGTICKVPDKLLKGNEVHYLPRSVTIGPLHHGKVITQAMVDENLKWHYLNALLDRKPGLEQTLDACVNCLKHLEDKVRKCYREDLDQIGSNEFVQMMLLDGCFIIELFLKYAIKNLRRRDDPCFTKSEIFFNLKCDLILLENQIPFFVLQHLFHLVPIPKQCKQSLVELAVWFFRKWIPGDPQHHVENFAPDVHHLLDLIRQSHLPANLIPEVQSCGKQIQHLHFPSATKLRDQGICFYAATTEALLNIKFDGGILEIPPLVIHKYTEIMFKNLVALESCSSTFPRHVTSYLLLMEELIISENDVRMLQNRQILINALDQQQQQQQQDAEEIIKLFRRFHDHLNIEQVDGFYYRWLWEKIQKHGEIKLQKHWCNKIKHFFAKSPFGIAGFSFAILVVVSIFTAALFTALVLFLHHVN